MLTSEVSCPSESTKCVGAPDATEKQPQQWVELRTSPALNKDYSQIYFCLREEKKEFGTLQWLPICPKIRMEILALPCILAPASLSGLIMDLFALFTEKQLP